jgi:RNA polymerase sigma factor (TIGR02999 family)
VAGRIRDGAAGSTPPSVEASEPHAGLWGEAVLQEVPIVWIRPMNDVTRILSAIEHGDPQAASQLLPLVYDELRKLAAHKLAREMPGQTLQPTALVHEAYLRLVGEDEEQYWDSRGHFFAAAAEAMRRILVEIARQKASLKRGGDRDRMDAVDSLLAAPEPREDLVALDAALTKLAETDKQAAELVQLRYFAGLPIREIADILGIAPRTADRLWAFAKAWLHQELARG